MLLGRIHGNVRVDRDISALREEMEGNLERLIADVNYYISKDNPTEARAVLDDAYALMHEFQLYDYADVLEKLESEIDELEYYLEQEV